jgi:hypothetical protein
MSGSVCDAGQRAIQFGLKFSFQRAGYGKVGVSLLAMLLKLNSVENRQWIGNTARQATSNEVKTPTEIQTAYHYAKERRIDYHTITHEKNTMGLLV